MIFQNNYFSSRNLEKYPIFNLKKIISPLLLQIESFRLFSLLGNQKIILPP